MPEMAKARDYKRTVAELIGGTVGGVMQTAVGHPLDTIKIRLQSGNTAFTGFWDCLGTTVRTEVRWREGERRERDVEVDLLSFANPLSFP
jgi:hypothetical protein